MKNRKKIRNKRGFTLAEVVTAVGILVIIVGFTGVIFKSGIEAYRQTGANAEIMQKLRAITTQLDRDFSQVRRDGEPGSTSGSRPKSRFQTQREKETGNNTDRVSVRMARIYYFTTGDFQSWYDAGLRNNTARVFFGHDSPSFLDANDRPLNKCTLARDVLIFTPENALIGDNNNLSFAAFAANPNAQENLDNLFDISIPKVLSDPYRIVRTVMCENVGELMIEWTLGEINPPLYILKWYPELNQNNGQWDCGPGDIWPKAIKFTFTIYDSKEIIKGGMTFTHIVYLD